MAGLVGPAWSVRVRAAAMATATTAAMAIVAAISNCPALIRKKFNFSLNFLLNLFVDNYLDELLPSLLIGQGRSGHVRQIGIRLNI